MSLVVKFPVKEPVCLPGRGLTVMLAHRCLGEIKGSFMSPLFGDERGSGSLPQFCLQIMN